MSGLCGWFSAERGTGPLAAMAAALGGGAQVAVHPLGSAALAAPLHESSLVDEEGLLIVCWGRQARLLAGLWRSHGAAACAALSGHFAFALYDARSGEGLLAVDRCATRPLHYRAAGGSLVFASSMEALARHPGCSAEVDAQAVFDYLYLGGASGPRALRAGQYRLGPGECLHLRGGRVERSCYWRMRYAEHGAGAGPRELRDALAGALARSTGPEGAGAGAGAAVLCAGGPASALLCAALRQTGQALHTYALGFGAADRDALQRAAALARHPGGRRAWILGPADAVAAAQALARHADGPCGDLAAVAMWWAARLAREDGLAQLHGGFGAAQLSGLDQRLATARAGGRCARRAVLEPLLKRLPAALLPRLLPGSHARLPGPASLATPALPARRARRLLALDPASVFERGFLAQVDAGLPAAAQEQAWWQAQARSPLNRGIDLALQGDLPYRTLPAFRAACDAAGVTPVLPYLDDGVLALCARMSPRQKETGAARRLWRTALREAGVRARRAPLAPAMPLGRWLREDAGLRALAGDSLSDLGRRHILRRDFIGILLGRRLLDDAGTAAPLIWQLMMLEQWLARGESEALPAAARDVAAC